MRAHILLVEDDAFLRKGLTELFEREGYRVTAAASAGEADEQMQRGRADLVVLDVTLPDGNGVELCRRWRAEGIVTPILFLTARDEEYEIVLGLDAGGNDYVTKPFRMQELLSRLRVLLRGVNQTAAVHRSGLDVDEVKMTVQMDGRTLALTPTEYKMLLLAAREAQNQECRRTGDLMADISHQLKTPLALLRLERLCADGYAFDFAEHDLSAMIQEAWQPLAPQYADKRLTISGNERLRCDEKWLGEAFHNILKNACEHTADDGRISAAIESTDKACFITFEDDGGGASEKDLPHLFERFYRAEGSKAEGSGIGLSMAREIVRRHQGDDFRGKRGERAAHCRLHSAAAKYAGEIVRSGKSSICMVLPFCILTKS